MLLDCRRQQLELPRRIQRGPARGEIEWVKPSYQAIYRILTHPAYAGAYTYGKYHNVRLPGAERKVASRKRPLEEWPVLIQDAFPGYITWNQYRQHLERLRQNGQHVAWSQGAPGEGVALLQGIVYCGHCGRRLHTRYSNHPAYICEVASAQYGGPRCLTFKVAPVDAAISQLFLEAVQPVQLEAALAAMEQVEAQRFSTARPWKTTPPSLPKANPTQQPSPSTPTTSGRGFFYSRIMSRC